MAQHFTCDGCGKPVELERFDVTGKRLNPGAEPLGMITVRRTAEILVEVRDLCPACIRKAIDLVLHNLTFDPRKPVDA